jgi:hypothetical protein
MVQINCTQKLGKFIKTGMEQGLPGSGKDWSAHLFFISGRKCIVFVHKKTLYTVLLLDTLTKDMTHINRLFLDALIGQLKADNILGNHEALIRDLYKEISLVSIDNDRKTLGTINNIISIFQYMDMESARKFMSDGVNRMPWQSMKYAYSKDIMEIELNLVA